jgi:hypothetical protein
VKAITILLLLFAQVISAQTNKGLVGYYPFNGNDQDESGKGNHPFVNTADLAPDRFGKKDRAYLFDGENSLIRIKNSSSLCPEELTLFAIIKPMGFYEGNCYNNSIIEKGDGDYYAGCYAMRYTAGEYTKGDCADPSPEHQNFVGMAGAIPGVTSGDTYVKLGTWYYVAFTLNKENVRLFLDGEMITSNATKGKIGKNANDLFFGYKNHPSFPYYFKGVIDEIRIYNRALSSEEIRNLYEELSKP